MLRLGAYASTAARRLGLRGGEDRTLTAICSLMAFTFSQTGGTSRLAYPSQVTLGGRLGAADRTIRRHVAALEAAGILTVYRSEAHQTAGGVWTRQTNRYLIRWRDVRAALLNLARAKKAQVAPRGHGRPVTAVGGTPTVAPVGSADALNADLRPDEPSEDPPEAGPIPADAVPGPVAPTEPPWHALGITVAAWIARQRGEA